VFASSGASLSSSVHAPIPSRIWEFMGLRCGSANGKQFASAGINERARGIREISRGVFGHDVVKGDDEGRWKNETSYMDRRG
jgi:hypothetical protein